MDFSCSPLHVRGTAARAFLLWIVAFGGLLAALARAAYDGPVPPATDAFGGPGPYAVVMETFPSPGWPERDVTVFQPMGAPGRRPVWFFAHGFGGSNVVLYSEFLTHLASHGAFVVFSPYPADARPANDYPIMFDGFTAAVDRFADRMDPTRVGFAGHSFGAGAVPALALRGVRERGWGGNGLALLLLAPWYSFFVSDADLASFPAGTQAVVQIYEDDVINDHRMAIDVFTHLNVPPSHKDFLLVRSDRIDGYNYRTDHNVPTGAANPRGGVFNALDSWGLFRIAQALAASTWQADPAARLVALGNGAAEQTRLGATSGGRALRPMVENEAPVPLYPESRYLEKFNGPLNPRRAAAVPQGTPRPILRNLSVRARSTDDAEVLIVGASVAGERPDSLLIRAVGPGLNAFGVMDAMPNPRLVLHRGTAVDIEVDDWGQAPSGDTLAAFTQPTGAFALAENSKDAALLGSFSPGPLTAHAPPSDGLAGVTLLELYEADADDATRLNNLSARARVGLGDDTLIAGFVVAGGDLRLLIRGVGPGLERFGIGAPLPDPELVIYRGNERIAANDNWSDDDAQSAAIAAAAGKAGAFSLPPGSADASVLLTLPPGNYTAHVRARDGRVGLGLVEVYVMD